MRLILASTSPRRRQILELLGLPFEMIAPDFEELGSSDRPAREEVLDFALGKAASVAKDNSKSIVIGSDTIIVLDEKKIGKPAGVADAKQILRRLSGKTHRIFTGLVILDGLGGPGLRFVEEVFVEMRAYSEQEIDEYLACNESLDKAGAYSIQEGGRGLIEYIRGDYLAAVGLSLKPIANYLKSRGFKVPSNVEQLYSDKAFLNWQSF
ncbi:MAG: septum formation protein Maf [Deltaproteobacteria bacterium]|nr:septum formation protein Maf [Deltaproteobacteria bacterium]